MASPPARQKSKVFCFFFSKKKTLLSFMIPFQNEKALLKKFFDKVK